MCVVMKCTTVTRSKLSVKCHDCAEIKHILAKLVPFALNNLILSCLLHTRDAEAVEAEAGSGKRVALLL